MLKKNGGILYPFLLILVSLCIALVYTLIPNRNVWVYILIKQELWSIFGIALYVELTLLCFPDLPLSYYLSLYGIGTALPPVIRSVAYLARVSNDRLIQTSSAIIGLPFIILFCSLHAYANQKPKLPSPSTVNEHPMLWKAIEATHCDVSNDALVAPYFDLYSTALSLPSPSSPETAGEDGASIALPNESMSRGRRVWLESQSLTSRPSIAIHMRPFQIAMDSEAVISGLRSFQHSPIADPIRAEKAPPSTNGEESDDSLSTTSPSVASSSPVISSSHSPHSCCSLQSLRLIFPRFYFLRHNISLGFVAGSNVHQCIHLLLFFLAFNAYFFLLIYYIDIFRRSNQSFTKLVLLFSSFLVVTTLVRVLLKRSGLALDRNKIGSTSIFFIAEFTGLMLFYTFYRLLFESVRSWALFFIFQALHLLWEWILYPLRASPWLYPYLVFLQDHPRLPFLRNALIPLHTNLQDWIDFIALDFGVRVVVMIATTAGMATLLLVVQTASWLSSSLQEDSLADYGQSILFIFIATALEVINAWAMNRLFFAKQGVDVLEKTKRIFQDDRFAIMVIIIGTNLFINPIYAYTEDNSYHYSQ